MHNVIPQVSNSQGHGRWKLWITELEEVTDMEIHIYTMGKAVNSGTLLFNTLGSNVIAQLVISQILAEDRQVKVKGTDIALNVKGRKQANGQNDQRMQTTLSASIDWDKKEHYAQDCQKPKWTRKKTKQMKQRSWHCLAGWQ